MTVRRTVKKRKRFMPKTPGQPRVSIFEQIKHIDPESGEEFWSSRDFAKVLGYADYDNFKKVLEKAKTSCENADQQVEDHFRDVTEMVDLGSGAQREIKTILLTRYACYLAIQNADPRKEVVAFGQTYFAVQTRRQELTDAELLEDEDRRLLIRDEIRFHNLQLADAALRAGVIKPEDYAIFMDHGYRGLYGGRGQASIRKLKGLPHSKKILDYMEAEEESANWFRITQTDAKLRREGIQGKQAANQVHYNVGKEIRDTIKRLGGTMPEDLPTPDESIQQLEARRARQLKKPPEEKTPLLGNGSESGKLNDRAQKKKGRRSKKGKNDEAAQGELL
jgi:DNA-damage-inducible protein D